MDPPRPAREASSERLLELVHLVRRELLLRDESPTGPWAEETAAKLHTGERPGWYLADERAAGLAFYSVRGTAAFGHVHVEAGPDPVGRVIALAGAVLGTLPPELASIDLGFTGLTTDDERTLAARLAERPGSRVIARECLDRALGPADGAPLDPPPAGLVHVPVRDVTMEALADLDVRAFRGTTDELLIGHEPADYERVLAALLDGSFGRFLDEASTALIEPEPPRLVGAILTAERSARRAIFIDFMVDPARQGHGVGRYLLRWGFRALRALGHERVGLWVTETNASARHLYETVGFRRTATALIYRWERSAAAPQAQSPR